MEALRQDSGRGCCSIWPSKWSAAWSRDQARGGVGPPGPGARGEGPPKLYHPRPPIVQPSQCPPVPTSSRTLHRTRSFPRPQLLQMSGDRLLLWLQLLRMPAPSTAPQLLRISAPTATRGPGSFSDSSCSGYQPLWLPGDRLLRRPGDRLLRRPGDRLLRRLCSCQICLDPVPADTSTGGLLID